MSCKYHSVRKTSGFVRFLGARGKVGNNPIFFEVILHEMGFIEVIEVLFSLLKILSKSLIL